MVDLSTKTIKRLFEQQVLELTYRTLLSKDTMKTQERIIYLLRKYQTKPQRQLFLDDFENAALVPNHLYTRGA